MTMTMTLAEEIRSREAVVYALPEEERHDREAWLVTYVPDAYEDQLGLKHAAYVVQERVVVHVTGRAEQYEGYGRKWYDSDRTGYSDDGRVWRWRQELVSYTGGGSWVVQDAAPGAPSYYQRPPWSPKGEAPRGYMLPDGTRATKVLEDPY